MEGDFAQVFGGRLDALRRASEGCCSSDGIAQLLERELLAVTADASRYSLEGPHIELDPDWAFALSLLFHELAMNAARHGSLSTEVGHVDIHWHQEDDELVLSWAESGGPRVRAPSSPGFGNLLASYAAVKLKGCASLVYFESGLQCDLRVSLVAKWPRRHGAMRLGSSEVRTLPV